MTSPDYSAFWDQKYKSDQAGWDLKSPAPVFEELLDSGQFAKPGKILIVGSGKGYDAVLAAKKGYDVYAVDFATEAVKFAKDLAEKENAPSAAVCHRRQPPIPCKAKYRNRSCSLLARHGFPSR